MGKENNIIDGSKIESAGNSAKTGSKKKIQHIVITLLLIGSIVTVTVTIIMTREDDKYIMSSGYNAVETELQFILRMGKDLKSGKLIKAVQAMDSYIKINNDTVKIRIMLAEQYFKMKKWGKCEVLIDQALKINPIYPFALWLKGECREHHSVGSGLSFYRKAAQQHNAGEKIWSMYGLFLLKETKGMSSSDKIKRTLEEARAYLTKAKESDSRQSNVYIALGQIAFDEENILLAQKYFSKAISLNKENGAGWYELSKTQKINNNLTGALKSLKNAKRWVHDNTRIDILDAMGMVYMQQQDYYNAAKTFHNAYDVSPSSYFRLISAAECYFKANRTGGHELGMAMQCIDIAYKINPKDPQVLQWKKRIQDARYGHEINTAMPN